ncbi:beta-glucosidase BglX [uncultured Christiangramia sp.]|uniref:beta-glucosidase BglX n=1 Tax=uncultured Christiangramia sp. TaxID=503836 RepID=UPI0025D76355|nr:beta-glucosidase BglX [uncultured Christiangramia sp.]|tara:strand:- start:1486 stop:3753 length:2268 start_codon:yes stop_codon:yes gene_type:complete
MKKVYLSLLCFTLFGISIQAQERIPEVEEILSKMTLEEKIGQLNLVTPGGGVATGAVVSKNVEDKIKEGKVGGLFGVSGPDKIRIAQEYAVNDTRLGIPLLIGSDVIHGYKTTFPIPLGTASSWDMDLIKQTAQVAATEATADGINWNFSPMVDIARDPRWGRIAEGAGEDPYLGSQIAKAMVEGYQGEDLALPNTMISTVKHFALYGAAEGGRDYNTTDMSRLRMFNEYLPPYKAALDAGAASVMSSFNDVDGIPASGNKWLLTELLRDRWGFDGFVVSDYTSVNEMIAHGLGDLQAVAALSLKAGLDMDMVGEGFLTTLGKSVKEGKVSEEEITTAARRILEAKHKLGLFEDPYKYLDSKRPETDILTQEHRDLARKAARGSFVLLKKHQDALPISKSAKIALVGPLADNKNNMLGTWAPTGDPSLSVSILEGFKNVAPEATISYAKGANISNDTSFAKKVNVFGPLIMISEKSAESMLEEALAVAEKSDIIIAAVGEATEMSGEAASRTDIKIPESQKKLIRDLAATGKPVVLVLMSGRPLDISEEMDLPVSILQVWHPGVEAGNAIADVVFGDYNPSGKITASWPRNVGQIPVYYSVKTTGRPAPSEDFAKFKTNYLDAKNSALIPFGYGLSYTTFEYSDVKADQKELSKDGTISLKAKVTNAGNYDGEEVVQLYIHDKVRSVTPPVKELKGFQKISLKKGESKTVTFEITEEDLKFYNSQLEFVAEPGEFEFFIGGSSAIEAAGSFNLKI